MVNFLYYKISSIPAFALLLSLIIFSDFLWHFKMESIHSNQSSEWKRKSVQKHWLSERGRERKRLLVAREWERDCDRESVIERGKIKIDFEIERRGLKRNKAKIGPKKSWVDVQDTIFCQMRPCGNLIFKKWLYLMNTK